MYRRVSIIIPTCGRREKLATCLAAIAQQRLPRDLDVETIVALDGGADSGEVPHPAGDRIQVLNLPRVGAAAARNEAMAAADGDLFIFANDDCYPAADWIARHVEAQASLPDGGMVIGLTKWRDWPEPTVFDGLLRDTSMVFFYDRMTPGGDYGFRHFWTCNASVPAAWARRVGGFEARLRPVFFEDIEFAYRLKAAGCPGVRYAPVAIMEHDHRLTWDDYVRREQALGRMAAKLGRIHPACFEAIYGGQPFGGLCELFQSWLEQDRNDHAAAERAMAEWVERPLASAADWPRLRDALYAAHLPLKRRWFREAFVRQVERGDADEQVGSLLTTAAR